MTNTDVTTYNGWANRETWLASLWLSNDEPVYLSALDIARNDDDPEFVGRALVSLLSAWVAVDAITDFTDEDTGDSLLPWVDLIELGEHWIADAREVDSYND